MNTLSLMNLCAHYQRMLVLQGWGLYFRQLRALFVKRALSARRDKWSVLLQLVIPILIVLVAIWTGKVSRLATDDPALAINR